MKPRQEIIDIFSTFILWENGQYNGWTKPYPKLRRSMEKCLAQSDSTSAEFWVLDWHKNWHKNQTNKLAEDHLLAYLQEPCYYAAEERWHQYQSLFPQYQLGDYFQIAIAKSDHILARLNQEFSNPKSYAKVAFINSIKDEMRRVNQTSGDSEWSLLLRTSETRLRKALENQGFASAIIDSYLLAWDCFKEIYAPTQPSGNRQLREPDSKTWKAIAQLYNNLQQNQDPECDAATIKQWMKICIKALKNYLSPQTVSLNRPFSQDKSGEFEGNFIDFQAESLLDGLIEVEEEQRRQELREQINSILTSALKDIEQQAQQLPQTKQIKISQEIIVILPLYYGQKFKQTEMAEQLKIIPCAISRRLKKAGERLLITLVQEVEEKMHISLDTNVINCMSQIIEEWLYEYFSNQNEGEN